VKSALSKANDTLFLLTVGLLAWLIPGAGHLMLKENRRAFIIFVTIIFTFCTGIYIGSIGIINPVGAKPWYIAQIMNSPAVAVLGCLATNGDYPVFGRPNEIGQIYTSIAGLLNLLCIVNAVYLAHLSKTKNAGG
jgi:hypothetical protein